MEVFLTILLFVAGLVLIIKGGDFFVDAATWMAEASGIPKFLIGVTVVSFATTLPEMMVSVFAALQGSVDMAVGNAVGSVTANSSLIMGLALIFMPVAIKRQKYLVQSVLMLGASAVVVACGALGSVSIPACVLLLALFALTMYNNIRQARTATQKPEKGKAERPKIERKTLLVNLAKFAGGAAGIVVGANLLVNSGSSIAEMLGVPERIIGVTVIALGTSLPELVTTLTAITKKQTSLSVGNIVGANIMNLTLVMPLASLVSGRALPISPTMAQVDLPVSLLVGVVGLVPALIGKRFYRVQGVLLVALYITYIILTSFVFV